MDDTRFPQLATTGGSDAGAVGRVLDQYVLGEPLERRAAADVYAAWHAHTRAPRLVYVLRPKAMQDSPLVHRAVYEADTAHWIRHPAAAKVDGYGHTPSRRLYVAVERPSGRPLAAVLAERGALAPTTLVRLAYRLVEALDEAHALGLAHGHLTPGAVIVADALDVADAGGGPLVTLTGLGVTAIRAGGALPTDCAYTSPERLAGAEPDVASDVFGLAALLYHALTGAPPDGAAGGRGVAHARAVAVLAAGCAADPAQRPASVKALWDDFLAALVAGEPSNALREAAAWSAGTPAPVRSTPVAAGAALAPTVTSGVDVRVDAVATSLATPPSMAAAGRRHQRRWAPAALVVGIAGIGLSLAHGAVLRAGTPSTAPATPARSAASPAHVVASVVPGPVASGPVAPTATAAASVTPAEAGRGARERGHADAHAARRTDRGLVGAEGDRARTAPAAEPAVAAPSVPTFIIINGPTTATPSAPTRADEFRRELAPAAPH